VAEHLIAEVEFTSFTLHLRYILPQQKLRTGNVAEHLIAEVTFAKVRAAERERERERKGVCESVWWW